MLHLVAALSLAHATPSAAAGDAAPSPSRQPIAPAPASAAAVEERVAALLTEADALYRERHRSGQAEASIDRCRAALALTPDHYGALWRIGRACNWLADGAVGADKARWAKMGWDAGVAAQRVRPDGIEGHFWGAACLGNYADGAGVWKAVTQGLAGKYEQAMLKAYRMDPRYEDDGAARALGRFYHLVPDLFGGPNEKAIALLEESKQSHPESLRTRCYLADVLLAEGQEDRARVELEDCLAADPKVGDYADNLRMQQRCRALASELE